MSAIDRIDFSKLTLRDAMDLAILIEDEAAQRYMELADQVDMHRAAEVATFFRFMSTNESKHAARLHARRKAKFHDAPSSVTRAMVFDVEAPEFEGSSPLMTSHQAFAAAMRSERRAHAFFKAALPHLKDAEAKALFQELCEEEITHMHLLRKERAKLAPPAHDFEAAEYDESDPE